MMLCFAYSRGLGSALLAAVLVSFASSVPATIITPAEAPASSGSFWLGNIEPPFPTAPGPGSGLANDGIVMNALRQGQWGRACSIATQVLVERQPDVEAVGVFALCAAMRGDSEAVAAAQKRLQDAELPPPYYARLVQGVVELRNKAPDKADMAFRAVLSSRPGDPLALYFSGEASHARGKDAEALSAFTAVLKTWPDYVPALVGTARLLATSKVSKKDLEQAIAMSERAAKLEPMNLGHWKLLADLCDRAGQRERAAAIRLQWLSQPRP